MAKRIIQVEEKVPANLLIPLSIQHMFAMFGASVLVPFLFGINPAIVLFMNGIGTLLFIFITKGKAPAYLGSSFAFIAPANIIIAKFGYPYACGGFVVVGFCGCLLAMIIKKFGTKWIDIVLPSAAMGPVVALIGLELSSSAANTAGILGDNIDPKNVIVFAVTLGMAVIGSVCFKKFLSVIPILIAVVTGYLTAVAVGIVDFTPVLEANFISIPNFQAPKFSIDAILMMLPVLLVITSEHIGHQIVTGEVVGRNLIKDPGLHRSLFADNFSTMISGLNWICSNYNLRRKHWSYGDYWRIQRTSYCWSCHPIHHLFIHWSIICIDSNNSKSSYRWNQFLTIRYDWYKWIKNSCRPKSRLWKKRKHDLNIRCIRCWT